MITKLSDEIERLRNRPIMDEPEFRDGIVGFLGQLVIILHRQRSQENYTADIHAPGRLPVPLMNMNMNDIEVDYENIPRELITSGMVWILDAKDPRDDFIINMFMIYRYRTVALHSSYDDKFFNNMSSILQLQGGFRHLKCVSKPYWEYESQGG